MNSPFQCAAFFNGIKLSNGSIHPVFVYIDLPITNKEGQLELTVDIEGKIKK